MKVSKSASRNAATRLSASLGVLPPGYLPASNRSGTTQYDSARGLRIVGIQTWKIENRWIGEMCRLAIAQRRENGFGTAGVLSFPVDQHPLDLLALGVVLRAAQLARDDGKLPCARITLD